MMIKIDQLQHSNLLVLKKTFGKKNLKAEKKNNIKHNGTKMPQTVVVVIVVLFYLAFHYVCPLGERKLNCVIPNVESDTK